MTDSPPSAPIAVVPAGEARLVLVTAPPDLGRALAHQLVSEGLAACVNLVPGVRSVYRWKGAVADDPETLLVVKTTAPRLPALARRLGALHPYETPEFLTLAPESGSAAYLAWLGASVAVEDPAPEGGG